MKKFLLHSLPIWIGIFSHFAIGQSLNQIPDEVTVNLPDSIQKRLTNAHADSGAMADAFIYTGSWYIFELGDAETGLGYLFQALDLSQRLYDSTLILSSLNTLARTYFQYYDFTQALTYFVTGFNFIRPGDERMKAIQLNYEGITYEALKRPDLANNYYQRSLTIFRNINDSSGIAQSLNYIGRLYKNQHAFENAIITLHQAQAFSRAVHDTKEMSNSWRDLSYCWMSLNRNDSASYYAQKHNTYAVHSKLLTDKSEAFLLMSLLYETTGNENQALLYRKEYESIKDNLVNYKNIHALLSRRMSYEMEQKQEEAHSEIRDKEAVAALQVRNEKLLRNIFIGGLLFVGIITILLFNRYRLKRKSEQQLLEKNAIIEKEKLRAERSEQFKSQFLANMSHEIRTPMSAVLGFANLLYDESNEDKRLQYISAIRKSAENLLVIVNDVLDLSKLEAGKMKLEKIHFRLRDQTLFIHEAFRLKAEEKELQLIVDVDDQVPAVLLGDPARLMQVMVNLVGNAVKFTERGMVRIEIKNQKLNIKNRLAGDSEISDAAIHNFCYLIFNITDTGIGIPKDQQQKIFESFTQASVSDNRKYGGTGLGLTISKNIIELMGGSLSVQSEEGIGSKFSFAIPFETGTEVQLEEEQKKEFVFEEDIGEELEGIHILVAEDNTYNQLLIADTLRKFIPGVAVEVAGNGKEAIQILIANHESRNRTEYANAGNSAFTIHHSPFTIVLMDIQMPEMDGYEATRIIRTTFPEPLSKIPILALTASVIRSDHEKSIHAEMNSYLPKPFIASELLLEIAKLLGKSTKTNDHTSGVVRKMILKKPLSHRLIEPTVLQKFASNDQNMIKKYLAVCLEQLPKKQQELENAVLTEDWTKIRSITHALKPQFSTLGINDGVRLAETIEIQLHASEKPIEELESLVEICRRTVQEIEEMKTA